MKRLLSRRRNRHLLGQATLLIGILAAGFVLRIRSLDVRAFWVDEAESSINALTILEHGYPTDSYLGLPIYENSFVLPWPDSAEYAWRDASYSDKHFAVYHGWLPLYSIAASFALQNVRPAKLTPLPSVQYDLAERKRRTRAARLPAVAFGIIFLLVLFAGGVALYGRDAAWAAVVMGALHPYSIDICRQARYYSAQVAFTTACCVSLWLVIKECRWRDITLAALSFILLFHTHLLSFATGAAVCVLATPFILRRHPRAIWKLSTFAAIVTTGTLPWLIVTGFLSHQAHIPRAWHYLKLPHDLFVYPPFHETGAVLGAVLVILFSGLRIFGRRLPSHILFAAARLPEPVTFLCAWSICGYVLFLVSMPLVSFDRSRLNLSYWGPALLLAAIVCAALARMLARRYSSVLAPAILLLLFFSTGHRLVSGRSFSGQSWATSSGVLNFLNSLRPDKSTRFYCSPNDQLVLTFYSGLPIQDILPIRRSFLNSYSGQIVYIDTGISVDTGVLETQNVRKVARDHGQYLSLSEAEQWSKTLRSYDYVTQILHRSPPLLLAFTRPLLEEQHRMLPDIFEHSSLDLMTRGFRIRSWTDWRNVLRYRFLNPQAHSGAYANYAERLRGATVTLLPESATAVYQSPALSSRQ